MNIRELMTTSLITTGPETPVLEARRLMNDKRIRHLLVTDGPKLLGIVTDRDIRLHPAGARHEPLRLGDQLPDRANERRICNDEEPHHREPSPGREGGGGADARSQDRSAPGGRRRQPYRDHYRDRSPSRLRGE